MWGGDWNHALNGREWAGSKRGRTHIIGLLEDLDLQAPTADLPHAMGGLLSTDHIAVPRTWTVTHSERVVAAKDGRRLSDHDAYALQIDLPE